jgi:hypothetical protein
MYKYGFIHTECASKQAPSMPAIVGTEWSMLGTLSGDNSDSESSLTKWSDMYTHGTKCNKPAYAAHLLHTYIHLTHTYRHLHTHTYINVINRLMLIISYLLLLSCKPSGRHSPVCWQVLQLWNHLEGIEAQCCIPVVYSECEQLTHVTGYQHALWFTDCKTAFNCI